MASVCIALAVGRFHHTRRPSADEPRCVAVGHRSRQPVPRAFRPVPPHPQSAAHVAPQRDGLQLLRHMLANLSTLFSYPSKAWRGKRPDSQEHDWLRGGVPYPDGAFHVLTDQGVLHDEGEAQGLDTPARAWRLAGRNRSGRIQNGALRRLGDSAVAGALDLPGDVLRGDAEVRGTGRIEGCGEEIGSTEPFLPPGCKREQRFVVPALGERAMPLEWNQQAHSEALESFSDVGR